MTADVLSLRALNRATLQRQLLLRRSDSSVLATVEHLVGMQAQLPLNPYVGLWSRLEGFQTDHLAQLLIDREVVRIVTVRGTLHLVTADDCLVLRPLAQPVLDRELARHRDYASKLKDLDFAPILAFARPLLEEKPRTGPQLRAAMAARFPEHDAAALAFACRNLLALVQVPPRGIWGRGGQVASTTAESWLGRSLATEPSIDDVVLRYFAAFGPATVADVAAWSRLTGLREVVERVSGRLRAFRDERGRELFDLPDAPRPDPDVPAPARFLPEYDNVVLSHADRTRFVSDEHRALLFSAEVPVHGSVLHDGALCGTWRIDDDHATVVVRHVGRLTTGAASELEGEGHRLLQLIHPEASDHDVRFEVIR
ncbi:MAG: hypothetical protein QOJ67_1596 [Acidimicrobiaceae bacterium]